MIYHSKQMVLALMITLLFAFAFVEKLLENRCSTLGIMRFELSSCKQHYCITIFGENHSNIGSAG
jgi:hypothetical protein